MSYIFGTRGFIFRKTVVYTVTVRYSAFCMHQYKQPCGRKSLFLHTQDCLHAKHIVPYLNCLYKRVPKDKPSFSKRVEDIKNWKLKYWCRKSTFRWFILHNNIKMHVAKHTHTQCDESIHVVLLQSTRSVPLTLMKHASSFVATCTSGMASAIMQLYLMSNWHSNYDGHAE
jgi:hypothetical protein